MPIQRLGFGASSLVLAFSLSQSAWGQASAPPAPTVPSPPLEAPPRAPAPPPAAAAVQVVAVPPGYKLVPIDGGSPAVGADEVERRRGRAAEVAYEEGDPIPPGYVVRDRPRRGLVIAGSIVTGVPWVFSVTGAIAADYENKSAFLMIPALGPWLMLLSGGASDDDCGSASSESLCTGSRAGLRAVLALDGMVQTAGAVMFIAGLALPRKRLVFGNDVALSIVPLQLTSAAYGVGAAGTF